MELQQAFTSAVEPPEQPTALSWWFGFVTDRLVVWQSDGPPAIVETATLAELGLAPSAQHYLGQLGDHDCWALDLGSDPELLLPDGFRSRNLRALYGQIADDLFLVAGRAVQVVEWGRNHQFCGRCGAGTAAMAGERARRCPVCGLITYPRLSPAVIVQVTRDNTILLARNASFRGGFYSVLAGFVEPGESLEETVQREIREEVGLQVANIRYFGSQPWPFPNSLMLGFTATWAGGEITIDERELAAADWFAADALPQIPPPPSIARRLIDDFIARQQPNDRE